MRNFFTKVFLNGKSRAISVVIVSITMTVAIFVMDIQTQRGITIGQIYIIPVITLMPLGRRYARLALAVATGLIWTGFAYSPAGVSVSYSITNRIISTITLWFTTLLVLDLVEAKRYKEAMTDTLNSFAIKVSDVLKRVREIKADDLWVSFPAEIKDRILYIEDGLGNINAKVITLRYLRDLRDKVIGDEDPEISTQSEKAE